MSPALPNPASRFWAGRRVAVTGATGFVGHGLASQLRHAGARVVALVRATSDTRLLRGLGVTCSEVTLDDPAGLTKAMAGCDVLFHVAGVVDFRNDWELLRRVNVVGTQNVLIAARAAKVRRVVHTSSIVAVGAAARPIPLDESAAWNLGPLGVAYATTKRKAEEIALAANGGLDVVVVNPACVVGPNDYSRSEFGTFCKRFWKGRIPFYFRGGNNFVDVRDVAAGHLLAAKHGRAGERYILGGENRTNGEFLAGLAAAADRRFAGLRVPRLLAAGVAAVGSAVPARRPIITPAQIKLASLYFHFTSDKARRDLGYAPRPLTETLRDAHAFWCGDRRAA
jgi:dihydroflavonol-4-reductase